MKIAVGFSFTSGPLDNLKKRGFLFNDSSAFFKPQSGHDLIGFKIQFVEDESQFPIEYQKHPFWPRLEEVENQSPGQHPNSLFTIKSTIQIDQITDPELKAYWKTRKFSPFIGLWLYCSNTEQFKKMANPDKTLNINQEKVYLIEMGPNCFDILVSERNN